MRDLTASQKIAQLELRIARMEKQAFLTNYSKKIEAWVSRNVPYKYKISKLFKSVGIRDFKSVVAFKKRYEKAIRTPTFKKAMAYIKKHTSSLKEQIEMVFDMLKHKPKMAKRAYYDDYDDYDDYDHHHHHHYYEPYQPGLIDIVDGDLHSLGPAAHASVFFLTALIALQLPGWGTFGLTLIILVLVGTSAVIVYKALEKMVEWGWIDDPKAKKKKEEQERKKREVAEFEESSHLVAEAFVEQLRLKDYKPDWVDDETFESKLTLINHKGDKKPLNLALEIKGGGKFIRVNVAGKDIGTYEYSERGLDELTKDIRSSKVKLMLQDFIL